MARRRTSKKQFLEVTWEDHHANGAWQDTIDHTPAICHSRGWLIKEDRKAITIAGSYTSGPDHVGNTQYILKSCIVKRRRRS